MRDAQVLAVGVLERVLSGRNLDTELALLWRHSPESGTQQRALVQDLCYGVLRHLGPLDALLAPLLSKPLRDERLRQLLRIALYQLQHTHAAQHAVVDQAVQACVALHAAPAKGLVNAVLRGFLRRQKELEATSQHSEVGRYSFPLWWINKIRTEFPQQYADILLAGNRHAPLSLRVNRRRTTRDDYLQRLAADGIAATAPPSMLEAQAVVLGKPMPVQRLPGFGEGHVSVQDVAAQIAAPLLDVADGMRVLDACAAPGGKSAHLLELADISLTAVDHDSARLQRINANLQRLGLAANVVCGDAANPAAWWDGVPFERILADVPCSASGVTRRHPDIKWSRRESDIAQFAAQQQAITDALWRLLAAGGKFLYVTCSVFREENHHQVERFLERHADARLQTLPLDAFPGARASSVPQTQHAGQILPDAVHDGFYYALLQKN
jgi:16S rRNA (cytosine967-C5)-methyltransferase